MPARLIDPFNESSLFSKYHSLFLVRTTSQYS